MLSSAPRAVARKNPVLGLAAGVRVLAAVQAGRHRVVCRSTFAIVAPQRLRSLEELGAAHDSRTYVQRARESRKI